MGSLLTSQRPAVWPAMLEEDIVDIFDNIVINSRRFYGIEASAILAWCCGMIDLYRSYRRGSMCV